jgi:NIMA (never in mitosis gene a)-related kinase
MNEYIILEEIGKGSYGRAVRALEKKTNNSVVIKVIDVSILTPKQRNDALNEANVLRQLRHPFIVRQLNNFVDRTNLCLTLEFADGGDLSALIKSQRLNGQYFEEPRITRWLTQILLGLSFIHSRNIMHRDLKPQNIFIMARDGRALIGDFGICRVLESKHDMAQTMVGTPYYLSPEVFQHRPYSLKSDIWALGCLLFELAALTVPFNATDFGSLSIKVCRGSNPPFPARYSLGLRDLFLKMLQRDHRSRPTADEIIAAPLISSIAAKLHVAPTIGTTGDSPRRTTIPSSARSPSPNKLVQLPPSSPRHLPLLSAARPQARSASPYRTDLRTPRPNVICSPRKEAYVRREYHQPSSRSSRVSYREKTPPRTLHSPILTSPRRVVPLNAKATSSSRSPSTRVKTFISPLKEVNKDRMGGKCSGADKPIRIYPQSPLRQRLN